VAVADLHRTLFTNESESVALVLMAKTQLSVLEGTDESALLLVDHWLSPFSPTAADETNVTRARVTER
jgi:hypothetical protein